MADQLLAPAWTSCRKRLQCPTYDVTDRLRSGENTVGVLLGSGRYRGTLDSLGAATITAAGEREVVAVAVDHVASDERVGCKAQDCIFEGWYVSASLTKQRVEPRES